MLFFNLPSMFTFKISLDSQQQKQREYLHLVIQTYLLIFFYIGNFLYLRVTLQFSPVLSNQQKRILKSNVTSYKKSPYFIFPRIIKLVSLLEGHISSLDDHPCSKIYVYSSPCLKKKTPSLFILAKVKYTSWANK